jgi:hypothetical protein
MAGRYIFNKTQFIPTLLIASLKITMLLMVEQCLFHQNQFTLTHLIAISQKIEQLI